MSKQKLGELEELMLLTVARLGNEAYGVSIKKELYAVAGRRITLSTVHEALNRLLRKGCLKSKFGEATNIRGGKRKKYFELTSTGKAMLLEAKEIRNRMWKGISIQSSKA